MKIIYRIVIIEKEIFYIYISRHIWVFLLSMFQLEIEGMGKVQGGIFVKVYNHQQDCSAIKEPYPWLRPLQNWVELRVRHLMSQAERRIHWRAIQHD